MCLAIERYTLTRPCGDLSDHPEFQPWATPAEMLAFGVFEGKYLNSTRAEYPSEWFADAKLGDQPDPALNCFGVKSRMPLSEWQARGWIHPQDPLGWFQWYARFYLGRRSNDDTRQIKRWAAFVRHSRQVALHGMSDVTKRRRQRQALLQWSWDPFPDCP
jgi:hypothetical protein